MMNKVKGFMPGRREAIELPDSNTNISIIQMGEINQTNETDNSFTTNLEISLAAHQEETESAYEGQVTHE